MKEQNMTELPEDLSLVWEAVHPEGYPNLIDMNGHETAMKSRSAEFYYCESSCIPGHPHFAAVGPHFHSYCEILFVCSEEPVHYLVDTERYLLVRGDVLYIPAGLIHCALKPDDQASLYKRYLFWIQECYLRELMDKCPVSEGFPPNRAFRIRTAGTQWAFLENSFALGAREMQQRQEGWQNAMNSYALQICLLLDRARSSQSGTWEIHRVEAPDLLSSMLAYISQHYAEPLSLQQAANRFFVSKRTVSQLFTDRLNISFYQYVIQQRLQAAEKLLPGSIPVEEIAGKTGFENYPTFYRAFKKHFGVSPSRYRSDLKKGITHEYVR